jgi:hypothetical protein
MPEDMKMKYDPLLALPWAMLPAAAKPDAIVKAAQAGRERAYYAIVASGGSEMCFEDGSVDDYVYYISTMKTFAAPLNQRNGTMSVNGTIGVEVKID